MKKILSGTVFFAFALMLFACGGGSGGGEATATLLAPDGSAAASLDVSQPVAAQCTGLSANTRYQVRIKDPSGTVVCDTNVFTDNNGGIPSSPYCYLRDKDTARFGTDGRVDAMMIHGSDEVLGAFSYGKAVTTGDYAMEILDSTGSVVITKDSAGENVPLVKAFPVTSTAARACASNSAGLCARSFLVNNSNVYATIESGSGVAEGEVVDIYVIGDRCSRGYASGTALQDVSTDGPNRSVTVAYNSDGIFTTSSTVWANPANVGTYDLVVDVDQSGTYTAGDLVEIIDPTPGDTNNPGGLCGVGFTVQDAYSTSSDVIVQMAMDINRAYQDVFSKSRNENVFAQLQSTRRLVHKFGVKKWVVAHKNTWTDGDVLVDVIPVTLDEVQTGCTNQQRRLVAPINLLSPGCYDIVFDVNADGIYNKGGDAVDNIDMNGANTCGFIVPDEGVSVTIDSIKTVEGTEVKDGTSTSISSKVTITGTAASSFTSSATVKAYSVQATQSGGVISGSIASGAFTITDVPLLPGANIVKVIISEGTTYGIAIANVTWSPGGATGIDIMATITWLSSTDMDTHFIKTGGSYTGRSSSSNYADCHYTNCTQNGGQALLWTSAAGSQTTSSDTSTGAIARLDLDCIGCSAKTENAWIQDASGVVPAAGNFLLCVVAFSGHDTPSAQININGVAELPLTAPSAIDSSSGNDMWFVGYVSQDASGNLTWHAANQVGVGAAVCKQP